MMTMAAHITTDGPAKPVTAVSRATLI
ncbi:uncharacterized protein METZ01_LOCUS170107, partial [marine metagenome]